MSIFDRMLNSEEYSVSDEDAEPLRDRFIYTQKCMMNLNSGYHSQEETLEVLKGMSVFDIDDSARIILPFYTDLGRHIQIGSNTFLNFGTTLLDQGGIFIGNDVKFGPNVSIITTNHLIDPSKRNIMVSEPVKIEDNCWIGEGVRILPGVTIGKNSVVGAGSVVTKDVPANTIVAGNPAKIVRSV